MNSDISGNITGRSLCPDFKLGWDQGTASAWCRIHLSLTWSPSRPHWKEPRSHFSVPCHQTTSWGTETDDSYLTVDKRPHIKLIKKSKSVCYEELLAVHYTPPHRPLLHWTEHLWLTEPAQPLATQSEGLEVGWGAWVMAVRGKKGERKEGSGARMSQTDIVSAYSQYCK